MPSVLLLAAGFGKRLGELTKDRPKPLVEVAGKPLIAWNLELLAREGIRHVLCNLHYRGEQIESFVGDGSKWGLDVECIHEPTLLDTGGAIRNVESKFVGADLLTVNSDIVLGQDFSLRPLIEAHRSASDERLATLVLREDARAENFGAIGTDDSGRITSFLGNEYAANVSRRGLMYLGVQMISRRLFEMMPPAGEIFSITRDTYVEALALGGELGSVVYAGYWNDVGTAERLAEVEAQLKGLNIQ